MKGEAEVHTMDEIRRIRELFESIKDEQPKIMAVLTLMSKAVEFNPRAGEVLTNEELGNLGMLLKETFGKVFLTVKEIEDIYNRCIYT